MTTQIDPLLGRACLAYNVQRVLSADTRAQLADIQDRLIAQIKAPLWRCPTEALHVSITPFLSVRLDYGGQKEALWRQHRAEWTERLRQSLATVREWTLRYREIRLTETAVFAVAEDGGVTNQIRRELALPESRGMDLVHTTLFRFASSFALSVQAERLIRAQRVAIVERPAVVAIAKETIYPSIACDVMERFEIASPKNP